MRKLLLLCTALLLMIAMQANAGIWPRQYGSWDRLNNGGAVTGDIKVPVIFVNFSQANSDDEYTISEANQNTWMTNLNATTNFGGTQYFKDMSYGVLNVTFEKVGVYTATGKGSTYASTYENLVKNAIGNFKTANWSSYDSNNDGFVDMVLLIYAGHADGDYNSSNAEVTSIYPSSGWLDLSTGTGTTITGISGVKFSRYLNVNDLAYGKATISNLGTALHELGHALFDLPDYYNKSTGNPSYGANLGYWDTMDYGAFFGEYANKANAVPGLSSFSRMLNGWLTPTELTEPQHCKLQPLNNKAECFMIKDTETHYYLLEARHAASGSWDDGLATGLLVTEVNEANNDWILYHQSNDGKVKVVTANKMKYDADNFANNLSAQPFGPKVNTIDKSYGTIFGTKTVENIVINADGSVEFDFMGGKLPEGIAKIEKVAKKQVESEGGQVTTYAASTEELVKGSGKEFLILSQNGWWGLGSSATASSAGPGTLAADGTGEYAASNVNQNGKLYSFKWTAEGYLLNIGLNQYLNVTTKGQSRSLSYSATASSVWTISGTGSNVTIAQGNYTLYSPTANAGAFTLSSGTKVTVFTAAPNFVDADPIDISIVTNDGYGTFYDAEDAYMMPNGLTGYFITDASPEGGKLQPEAYYNAGDIVPAGTALLLMGNKGNYSADLYSVNSTGSNKAYTYIDAADNLLEGTRDKSGFTASSRGDVYYYKLTWNDATNHDAGVGFYWGAADGAAFHMANEHTAYLAVEKSAGAKGYILSGDMDDSTGIVGVNDGYDDGCLFNIAGQRVGESYKGIIIKNGKKVLKK